jgi:peptidoglycan-associated lipoprotein
MKVSFCSMAVAVVMMVSGVTGCATQEYVKKQTDEVLKKVQANEMEIADLKKSDSAQNDQLHEIWVTVQEALDRADKAGKLAEGKFLYGVTLSDEYVNFGFNKSDLSDEAKAALDALAGNIKEENKNVYIEIQGHTDSSGTEEYNAKLGQIRAEKVLRYLHVTQGFPLHRMSAFSYGESKPVAGNSTRSDRAKNRRVTIIVME